MLRLRLIVASGILGLLGIVTALWGSGAYQVGYCLLMGILTLAVCGGGLLHYFSQEAIDFREVHREKYRMLREKFEARTNGQ